jgi:ABC-type glycerol-3-phosphate transport system substrate-binding protein
MKTTPFQLVILAVFGFLGLLGVAIFAMTTAGGKSTEIGEVVIWGTFPERQLSGFLHDLGTTEKLLSNAVYVEKSEKTFYQELTDGLASGKGPDLIIMDQPHVEKYKDALIVIPYTELSQRAYMDAFIDATSTLLTDEGMYGIPFAVDPLVMYWNKDIFCSECNSRSSKILGRSCSANRTTYTT